MNLIPITEFHSNFCDLLIPLLEKGTYSHARFKWLLGENVHHFLKRHCYFEGKYDFFHLIQDQKYFESEREEEIEISIYKVKSVDNMEFFLIVYGEIGELDCLSNSFCVPANKFNLLIVKKYFIDLGYKIAV